MTNKNIVLCGFMGCGKTTVGKLLAEKLERKFVDMDKYVEERAKMPVSEIFAEFGEAHFRELEHKSCEELSLQSRIIIATGGGAITFKRNELLLKANGTVVFLDVSKQTILQRLSGDETRPLLISENREETVRKLFDSRQNLYNAAADFIVSGEDLPEKIAGNIIQLLT